MGLCGLGIGNHFSQEILTGLGITASCVLSFRLPIPAGVKLCRGGTSPLMGRRKEGRKGGGREGGKGGGRKEGRKGNQGSAKFP